MASSLQPPCEKARTAMREVLAGHVLTWQGRQQCSSSMYCPERHGARAANLCRWACSGTAAGEELAQSAALFGRCGAAGTCGRKSSAYAA